MNALVSADEALERGEVPTVPHEGSPVLLSDLRPRDDGRWEWWWHFDPSWMPVEPTSSGAQHGENYTLRAVAEVDAHDWREWLSRTENSMEHVDASPRPETP